ncbi:MAG: hypothetical protein JNM72_20405 [Deltaproteobacteria bacterium]|nr:hypothetical protein [Deltaproteobacteria bacterium]
MRVELGVVSVQGGALAVVDFGLLRGWAAAGRGPAAQAAARAGGGSVDFGGPNVIVVGGVPDGTHRVVGTRGADPSRWRSFEILIQPGAVIAQISELGDLIVDEARLMICALPALDAWAHDQPADGRADLAFWGRDADQVAAEVGAQKLPEGVWGWADVPLDQGEPWFRYLEGLKAERGLKLMVDWRPHSHPFMLLGQIRAKPEEVGQLSLAGGIAFGAMTSWGDGVFPVLALRDAAGALVGLRIDLARDGGPDLRAVGLPVDPGAAPLPGPGAAALPPTPQEAAARALTQGAKDVAGNMARRAVISQVKGYLPRFLWPLIPGQGGSVEENVKKMAGREVSKALWGCGCSVLIIGFIGMILLLIAAYALYLTKGGGA